MSSLDELIKATNKKFKNSKDDDDVIHFGLPQYNFEKVPFTSPRLNYMTFGGLPIGKLIEFSGAEHSGKSTTALDIIANYQHKDNAKQVIYIDAENTLDTEWALKLGVDTDNMILMQTTNQSAEEIFQFVLDAVNTGEVGLVVIDSIAVLVTEQALGKEMTEKTYAGVSGPLTTFSNKVIGPASKNECMIIGINQVRDNLNSPYGGTSTPGGHAWKHSASVRLEFRRGKFIDAKGKEISRSSENPQGNLVEVVMLKNKTCPPTRKNGYYTLRYDTGIDYLADLVELAIKYDVILQSGAWFTIQIPEHPDTDTGEIIETNVIRDKIHGQAEVYDILSDENNIDILQQVESWVDYFMSQDK